MMTDTGKEHDVDEALIGKPLHDREVMRDIKFRGKTFKGDFVYGDLTNDTSGLSFNEKMWIRQNYTENNGRDTVTAYWEQTTKRIHWKTEKGGWANAPVDPKTVGQYTGLKDKNGVEIYLRDICHCCGAYYEVKQHINGIYELHLLNSDEFPKIRKVNILEQYLDQIEVIDKNENPDLLEDDDVH